MKPSFKAEISDMTGNIVMNVENQEKINISGLTNGVYMVTVKTDQGNTSRKLIIEK